ncbi:MULTISPECIES: hypothetical protein [unclassified Streptomyces]|uniref:hypothetical protein n=1 Tax=unclassified Streptomyces TaxID=2593676 RepID=UPI002DD98A63|nr:MULTISPECIES: hypothetical protein [unclassified Streptomyces]WSA92888.1 hypothetical protein OIE63_15920 [Streptomyces sp. NBC_01795]WSB77257.1 hypothetical protein OHB04_16755 [Streptomyces sp. NBC_01775]WSS14478.1 hypothetical protein OG533_23215 [Streptomyces sp. NBC_01186]WSS43295.1 hypothetical protein OG220_23895 [Streptomyces sp. NBC_01187]
MNSEIPPVGAYAVDVRTGRVGQVMDGDGPYVQQRPPRGGCGWDVPPEAIRAARVSEELSARVTDLNWQSRLP